MNLIILIGFLFLLPSVGSSQFSFINLKNKHIGFEYNLFWGMGDSELIVADWENHAQGILKEVEEDFFDSDFSLQYTFFKKFVGRYTYIKLNANIDGPIGPDLGYKIGDRYSLDYDLEEIKYEYEDSGSQNISHIFSTGYPIKVGEIKKNPFWGIINDIPIEIIVFGGISFHKSSKMDMYTRTEGFSDWYFMDEYDWYIENRITKKSNKLSFGVTLPVIIQISLFYTGEDVRLMFGLGL